MNKKIKVIELINKMYANLDVPEKVKYADKKYEYNKATQDYKSEDGEWLFQRMHTFFERWLEREVEILEDEEEIDINDLEDLPLNYKEVSELSIDSTFIDFHNNTRAEINKIIKYLKQLDKKINKED